MAPDALRDLGDRLDAADLVVGEHDRDEDRPVGDRGVELVGVDAPVAVDRHLDDLEPEPLEVAQRVADRVVLDRRGDDPVAAGLAGPRGALDRKVVRLGPAGREDDLARLGVEAAGDPLVGLVEGGRAFRPNACADDGFPNCSVRNGSIASSASGRSGVVAAWSR